MRRATFDIARVVLHEDGIVVETFQREGAQVMRELVAPRFEFAIRSLRDVGNTAPSTAKHGDQIVDADRRNAEQPRIGLTELEN